MADARSAARLVLAVVLALGVASCADGGDVEAERTTSVSSLEQTLTSGPAAERVRAAVSLAMLGRDAESAHEALRGALADPAPDVRLHAALALAAFGRGNVGTIEALIDLQEDAEPRVRSAARNALDLIEPERHIARRVFEEARYAEHCVQILTEPGRTEWHRVECEPEPAEPGDELGDCWTLAEVPPVYTTGVERSLQAPGRCVWQRVSRTDSTAVDEGAPVPETATETFAWHERLADAQKAALSGGRLLLCAATKPGCELCEKFRRTIVPRSGRDVRERCVGYVVRVLQPEAPEIWGLMRQNLPNERLMPLVVLLTPDLRFLAGFGGPASEADLVTAIATAARLYPQAGAGTAVWTAPLPSSPSAQTGDGPVVASGPQPPSSRPGEVWCYWKRSGAGGDRWEWSRVPECEVSADTPPFTLEVVAEPALVDRKTDAAVQLVTTVENTGRTDLDGVEVACVLPEGLEATSKQRVRVTLAPGASRTIVFTATVEADGVHEIEVRASAPGVEAVIARTSVSAEACGIEIEIAAPRVLLVGEPGRVILTASNPGGTEIDNAVVRATWRGVVEEEVRDYVVGPLGAGATWTQETSALARESGIGHLEAQVFAERTTCDVPPMATFVALSRETWEGIEVGLDLDRELNAVLSITPERALPHALPLVVEIVPTAALVLKRCTRDGREIPRESLGSVDLVGPTEIRYLFEVPAESQLETVDVTVTVRAAGDGGPLLAERKASAELRAE